MGLNDQEKRFLAIKEELNRQSSKFKHTHISEPPVKLPLKKPISIIIYAYKIEDHIQECLDSIEKQSWFVNNNNFEIIIGVDDCKNTSEKLYRIKDNYRNIQVYHTTKHKGNFVTLNTLLDMVKFDNILPFMGDDIMKPDMIEEILKYTDEYDIVKFDYQDFDEEITNKLKNKFWFNNGIFLFNKHVVELVGGYKDWVIAADIELFERVYNFVKVKEIKKVLFYKRQNKNDFKLNKDKKLKISYDKQIKKYKNNENIKIDKIVDEKIDIKKVSIIKEVTVNTNNIDENKLTKETEIEISNVENKIIENNKIISVENFNDDFYLTRTIPKRMFFYWGGSNLSWMRYMTLYSFRKMNPDWEVVLYVSDDNIKNKGWKSREDQDYYNYKGDNYFNNLKDLNIKIEKAEFPKKIQDKLKHLSPIHKSDLYRYYQLFINGGFYCDMDVLFFRPIDDLYNEIIDLEYDTVIHEYKSSTQTLTIGFLGACINNEYYKNLFEFGINYCINRVKNTKIEDNYQSMGVQLIYRMISGELHIENAFDVISLKYPNLKFFNLPTSLIYKFDWTKINYCFSNSIKINEFDWDSIGYHWYGGGKESQYYNNILNEKNYKNHKITFTKIADEVINMKVNRKGYVIFEKIKKPNVSIVISTFNRAELLNLGLSSIASQKIDYPLEIIIVNDGVDTDDTKKVCDSYKNKLNTKYIFSGHRNSKNLISRNPGIPLNIGIKNSSGDIIILTCPEIYHINNGLNQIIKPLIKNHNYLTVPKSMYFDDLNEYTSNLLKGNSSNKLLSTCEFRTDHIVMPFLMGIWKQQILDIGGYDEDFTGYACDDNDFVDRLKLNGCEHYKVESKIVHLYHGKRCTGDLMWDNSAWAYNYNLYLNRKNIIIRNKNKEWGKIPKVPKISIVTAYYNRKNLFYETLKSISKSKFKDFELIVVDDGSSPEHRIEEFVFEFPFLKLIRIEPKDKWYVNPCIPFNIGIRAAVGDIIILQNPECLHVHDVLMYINKNIDDTKYITMSAYALDEKLTQDLKRYIEENNSAINFLESLVKDKWKHKTYGSSNVGTIGWYNHSVYRAAYFHFCSAMTRKNMEKLNGFDERFAYGIGFDDNDLVERINRLGLNKIIVDNISVIHQYHPQIYYQMRDFEQLHLKNHQLFKTTSKETNYNAK